jgi:hypothetical protein
MESYLRDVRFEVFTEVGPYFLPKRRFTQDLYGSTSQKTAFFLLMVVLDDYKQGIASLGRDIDPSILQSLTHSWSWTLLEKLTIVQLPKNFPAFYGTRRFIAVFTRTFH